MCRGAPVIIVPLVVAWVVIPPAIGHLIGRWWALTFALLFFLAYVVWREVSPAGPLSAEPVFETWFNYLLAFLFLTLPPLGLSAVAVAWRRWS